MKNVYRISTKQHGDMKSDVSRIAIQKLGHLERGVCWCTVLLEGVKVKLSPQVCESDRFGRFCGYNVKTSTVCHQWTRWSLPSNRAAIQQLSAPVPLSKFVLTAYNDVSISSW